MAALNLTALNDSTVGTVVHDKYGDRYFKLVEGTWASSSLHIVEAKELAKKRPEVVTSRHFDKMS